MMIQSAHDKGDKHTGKYDLVEQVQYLYVRVVKARDLPTKDDTGRCDPYAEVRLGTYKGTTRHIKRKSNPDWNQVFAFTKDKIQASVLEVSVKDNYLVRDHFIGWVVINLTEVSEDGPVSASWFKLRDRKGNRLTGELMLAVWWGTQADEAFSEAWHSDAASVGRIDNHANIRSKVYFSPNLWYLRVNVIEAQDLIPSSDTTNIPELVVKVTLGRQVLRTKVDTSRSMNPIWNEELMFVAEEPFEEPLILSVEDCSVPYDNKVVGTCAIHLQSVERRLDHKAINSKWFNLENDDIDDGDFASRLLMAICLEGGYHVFDESTQYSSDFRPTSEKLWKKKSIGVLELGFLGASGLLPMKRRNDGIGKTDAYCVAKYGKKWVRTRTIIDSFAPKWNEQYNWEVFDPCTVITIGVFDNCHLEGGTARDSRIGKVRIRLSTLETGCVYTHSYPLLVLHPNGVKKMGEIRLAVRFTCPSLLNMVHMYSQPLLPKMHEIHPLTVIQIDSLRHQATQIVVMRFSRAEPPLKREVVEYMVDAGSDMWSFRKCKSNFFRIMGVLGGLITALNWFDDIRTWKNPITTILVHIIFVILILYPVFILPSVCVYLLWVGVWNHIWRPRYLSHLDIRLSYTDSVHPDELDEEFDTFPTSRTGDIVRMRYDRLRCVSGRIQTLLGDLATHGERLQCLLSWRDPRATTLFIIFLLIASIVLYAKPFYVVVFLMGFNMLSHPRFQHKLHFVPLNFFRRLPSKSDYLL